MFIFQDPGHIRRRIAFVTIVLASLAPILPGSGWAEGNQKIRAKVVKIIDGDSFVIEPELKNSSLPALKEREELRAIGINAFEMTGKDPQRLLFSRFQRDFAWFLLYKKWVYIELETTPDLQFKRDKYNRLLGFIFLDESRMYQEMALKEGLIKGFYAFPFKKEYETAFKKAEAESQADQKGLLYGYPPLLIKIKGLAGQVGKVVKVTFLVNKVVFGRKNIYLESESGAERRLKVTVPPGYQKNFIRGDPGRYFRSLRNQWITVTGFLGKAKDFLEIRLYYPAQLR